MAIDAERIYRALPVTFQEGLVNLYGLTMQKRRFNAQFKNLLDIKIRNLQRDPEVIAKERDQRLLSFVQKAFLEVPYYQQLAKTHGIQVGDLSSPATIEKLPILLRVTVQKDPQQFLNPGFPVQKLTKIKTGGTTGAGLKFWSTWEGIQEQLAVWWRYRYLHGITLDTWCSYFGGRVVVPLDETEPPFWRTSHFSRQIIYSGYHMKEETVPFYLEHLRRKKIPWIHGLPSLISIVARYLADRNETIGYPVKWVTIGAENLLEPQKQVIRRAFGCEPLQHYGMEEAASNISQFPKGDLLVDEDFAYTEFGATPLPNLYRIIGTNLANPAFPLIRYEVGDQASATDDQLAAFPRQVKSLDGRLDDMILLPNGNLVTNMDMVFKDLSDVHEAQIQQKEKGSVRVFVVRGNHYNEDSEQLLMSELRNRLGNEMNIGVQYVNAIQKTAAGKHRLVVSSIAR